MQVYVLYKDGRPLKSCSPKMARLLLRDKKVRVVQTEPFTIQLLYSLSESVLAELTEEYMPPGINQDLVSKPGRYKKKKRRYRRPPLKNPPLSKKEREELAKNEAHP